MTHAIKPTSQCILSATAIAAVLGALVSPAHAGIAEQALARANAKVQAAIVHDVCEVHSTARPTPRSSRSCNRRSTAAPTRRWRRRNSASSGLACRSPRAELKPR
jgi:tRNA U34 5-methylaminomethyl-2-thiouridine-forming methyltransferase MnmC